MTFDPDGLRDLLAGVRDGTVSLETAVEQLSRLPFAEVGEALVDHHRALRQGMPEAVYGPGKSPEQCVEIVGELLRHGDGPVLLTRATDAQAKAVIAAHVDDFGEPRTVTTRRTAGPDADSGSGSGSSDLMLQSLLGRQPEPGSHPRADARVLVATAGTADTAVADEADLTLAAHGISADRLHDVGVAGLHRLLAHIDRVTSADAVIVAAGMEGALASVVGGLTAAPVVAIPTSVGYGSGLDGVTALLAMHASCASGVTVVGVDNGFGAAVAVVRMLTLGK
ncbi:MAG: nickel pincer cofactor biosynthesis protein LarB [Ilumatobacteraceae bacterium]